MSVSKKIVLRFPTQLADKPIVWRLVKDFNLQFNILRASINPDEEGLMVMEIAGKRREYDQGLRYLRQAGVEVQLLSKDVSRTEGRCTHCGACVALCPAGAFDVEPQTRRVDFFKEKCLACEICIKACPVRAMELHV
jgi:ferredoxin